jgi:hypothetical protein
MSGLRYTRPGLSRVQGCRDASWVGARSSSHFLPHAASCPGCSCLCHVWPWPGLVRFSRCLGAGACCVLSAGCGRRCCWLWCVCLGGGGRGRKSHLFLTDQTVDEPPLLACIIRRRSSLPSFVREPATLTLLLRASLSRCRCILHRTSPSLPPIHQPSPPPFS